MKIYNKQLLREIKKKRIELIDRLNKDGLNDGMWAIIGKDKIKRFDMMAKRIISDSITFSEEGR